MYTNVLFTEYSSDSSDVRGQPQMRTNAMITLKFTIPSEACFTFSFLKEIFVKIKIIILVIILKMTIIIMVVTIQLFI